MNKSKSYISLDIEYLCLEDLMVKETGQIERFSADLMNLLKKSHLPEYAGIVDKEIVSEITELLKEVTDNQKIREN